MQIRCMRCMELYDDEYEICPSCGYIRGTKPQEEYHLHPEVLIEKRYLIGTVLGYGGFGITYKAWDTKLDRIVAIKEHYPVGLVNRIPGEKEVILYSGKRRKEFQDGIQRFLNEAKNTTQFAEHPNIVHVLDYFEENGTAYMVMEYLDGMTLKKYISECGGKIDVDIAIQILTSVIEALRIIHAKGILHRDISPDNIFMCSNGIVKLIDFGASRFSTGEEEKTLSIVLKPGYAPPEQYRSRSKQGPWTDIYALAATLYYAITGVVPDESSNREVEDTLKSPRELNPDIPEYLDMALMVAMSIQPELRYQNVKQFENAIKNKTKVISLQEDLKRRKRKRIIGISVVTVCVVLGSIGAWIYFNGKKKIAELEPTEITMWVEIPTEADENVEEDRMNTALQEFYTTYPQVKVSITCIPEDVYMERLEAAAASHTLPTVFESTGVSEDILLQASDISDILSLLGKNDYYYLNRYTDYFPDGKQIPTGFVVPVEYVNTTVGDEVQDEGNYNEFISETCRSYIDNCDSYAEIQMQMIGKYQVMVPETIQEGMFVRAWSVSVQEDRGKQAAGERVIYYLLGEVAQDTMYVQDTEGLPLNKNEFEVYIYVNSELMFLKDYIEETEISVDAPFTNGY